MTVREMRQRVDNDEYGEWNIYYARIQQEQNKKEV